MARPATIAIDGPVASGKSSVGQLLCRELGYRFLDTGIMYRALTWLALERGISMEDEPALGRLANEADIRPKDHDKGIVVVGDRELTEELREPEVERAVSLAAKVPAVRRALVDQQREIARAGRIVVAGRDIGTVVLPRADMKLFLMASVSERARRRYEELIRQGVSVMYGEVLDDLVSRDGLDTNRADSPLRPASDALIIDTDGMDVNQVAARVLELTDKR